MGSACLNISAFQLNAITLQPKKTFITNKLKKKISIYIIIITIEDVSVCLYVYVSVCVHVFFKRSNLLSQTSSLVGSLIVNTHV